MKQGGYAKPGKVIYIKDGKETELYTLNQNHYLIEVKKDLGIAL
jgi:hypothetical protein